MPTIRDIAKRADVSAATVSRVLNRHENVADDTRELVLRVAQEIGYNTERIRRAPTIASSVVVLTRDTFEVRDTGIRGREFEHTVWLGVHSFFGKHGIAARLQSIPLADTVTATSALDASVAGLVLLGGIIHQDFVSQLLELNVPFVVVGAHMLPLQVNCVMADVFRGMRAVVSHLITTGHRRIGFVNGPTTTSSSAEKLSALQLELGLNGLPFHHDCMVQSEFEPEAGYQQTLHLLDTYPEVDAIVYADDDIAIGGLKAIRETGRRIPDDIAVTGFGDYRLARFVDPNLTTVHYDMYAMGRIAARRLAMLMEEADDDRWLTLAPTFLVKRESTK